jgi:hypothetical protein
LALLKEMFTTLNIKVHVETCINKAAAVL